MELFKLLPDNFFSVLASPNKQIYFTALMTLRRCYRLELSIRKTEYIAELVGDLSRLNLELAPEDDEIPEDNLSGRAHFLLRKLIAAGWVEEETEAGSFEDALIIPDYAVKILNLFHELTTDEHREYNKYVYTTYSILKNADQEQDDYLFEALDQAHRNTEALVSDLKSLLSNIRRYHQLLLQQADVRSVLSQHFDQFSEQIDKKVYHPIKTFDSVPRFKAAILGILYRWREDVVLKDRMADLALARNPGRFNDIGAARLTVQQLLDTIIGHYEQLESLVSEIDRKHRRYLLAAYDRIQYLLQSDQTIKGKVVHLLNALPQIKEDQLEDMLQEHLQLYKVGHFTEQDLFTPRKRRADFTPEPLPVRSQLDMADVQRELDSFADRVRQGFDQRRILAFMERQFGDKTELTADQLQIENSEDFILTLLAVLRHDDPGSFYRVQFGDTYLLNNGYRIPTMTLTRRGGGE